MAINETIIKRRSIRAYSEKALEPSEITRICECIHGIKTPIDIVFKIKIVSREEFKEGCGGLFVVKAPNYALVYSKEEPGYLFNSGFATETLVLGLTAMGYATCILGGAKAKESFQEEGMKYVIAIAIGRSEEGFRVCEEDASRKDIADLASGDVTAHEEAIRAGRLAPSGMNLQPVRYLASGDCLHMYLKKSRSFLGMFDKMQQIDSGIAAANIIAACPCYEYSCMLNPPLLSGCTYVATLTRK